MNCSIHISNSKSFSDCLCEWEEDIPDDSPFDEFEDEFDEDEFDELNDEFGDSYDGRIDDLY